MKIRSNVLSFVVRMSQNVVKIEVVWILWPWIQLEILVTKILILLIENSLVAMKLRDDLCTNLLFHYRSVMHQIGHRRLVPGHWLLQDGFAHLMCGSPEPAGGLCSPSPLA